MFFLFFWLLHCLFVPGWTHFCSITICISHVDICMRFNFWLIWKPVTSVIAGLSPILLTWLVVVLTLLWVLRLAGSAGIGHICPLVLSLYFSDKVFLVPIILFTMLSLMFFVAFMVSYAFTFENGSYYRAQLLQKYRKCYCSHCHFILLTRYRTLFISPFYTIPLITLLVIELVYLEPLAIGVEPFL